MHACTLYPSAAIELVSGGLALLLSQLVMGSLALVGAGTSCLLGQADAGLTPPPPC